MNTNLLLNDNLKKKGKVILPVRLTKIEQEIDLQTLSPEEKKNVIAKILKMDPKERKEDDVMNLKELTQDLEFFVKINSKKFNQESKLHEKICRRLKYESLKKGQTVIEYGAKADKFFIILSGEVSVFLIKSPEAIEQEEQMNARQGKRFHLNGHEETDFDEDHLTKQNKIFSPKFSRRDSINPLNNQTTSPNLSNLGRKDQIIAQITSNASPNFRKRYSIISQQNSLCSLNQLDKKEIISSEDLDESQLKSQFVKAKLSFDAYGTNRTSPLEDTSTPKRTIFRQKLSIFNMKQLEDDDKTKNMQEGKRSRPETPVKQKIEKYRGSMLETLNSKPQEDDRNPQKSNLLPIHLKKSVSQIVMDPLLALQKLRTFLKISDQNNNENLQNLTSNNLNQKGRDNPEVVPVHNELNNKINNIPEDISISEQNSQLPSERNSPLLVPTNSSEELLQNFQKRSNSICHLNQKNKPSYFQQLAEYFKSEQIFGSLNFNEIEGIEKFFSSEGVFKYMYKDKILNGLTFGELGILDGKPRSALIICSQDSEFAIMEKDDYSELLAERDRKHLLQKFEFLKKHIFPDLTNDGIRKIFYSFQRKTMRMHEVLFSEGEIATGVYIIKKGEISLSKRLETNSPQQDLFNFDPFENNRKGNEFDADQESLRLQLKKKFSRTFAVIGRGEYFGEEDLILKDNFQRRDYTATCTSLKGSVYFVDGNFFMKFLKQKPSTFYIIQSRLDKKMKWRTENYAKILDQYKQSTTAQPLQEQEKQQSNQTKKSTSDDIKSPTQNLFSCVDLSEKTLKIFLSSMKSPKFKHIDHSASSSIVSVPQITPSLSYLIRDLKPMSPISKQALSAAQMLPLKVTENLLDKSRVEEITHNSSSRMITLPIQKQDSPPQVIFNKQSSSQQSSFSVKIRSPSTSQDLDAEFKAISPAQTCKTESASSLLKSIKPLGSPTSQLSIPFNKKFIPSESSNSNQKYSPFFDSNNFTTLADGRCELTSLSYNQSRKLFLSKDNTDSSSTQFQHFSQNRQSPLKIRSKNLSTPLLLPKGSLMKNCFKKIVKKTDSIDQILRPQFSCLQKGNGEETNPNTIREQNDANIPHSLRLPHQLIRFHQKSEQLLLSSSSTLRTQKQFNPEFNDQQTMKQQNQQQKHEQTLERKTSHSLDRKQPLQEEPILILQNFSQQKKEIQQILVNHCTRKRQVQASLSLKSTSSPNNFNVQHFNFERSFAIE